MEIMKMISISKINTYINMPILGSWGGEGFGGGGGLFFFYTYYFYGSFIIMNFEFNLICDCKFQKSTRLILRC